MLLIEKTATYTVDARWHDTTEDALADYRYTTRHGQGNSAIAGTPVTVELWDDGENTLLATSADRKVEAASMAAGLLLEPLVMEQMNQVRSSGLCNMLSRDCVYQVADALGLEALARATESRHTGYSGLLLALNAWMKAGR